MLTSVFWPVCSWQIPRDHVKDRISYRCKALNIWLAHFKCSERKTGRGKSTVEGCTTVIEQRWTEGYRGLGRAGVDDCTTAYTCSHNVCLSVQKNQYSFIFRPVAKHRKSQEAKKETAGANQGHNGSSEVKALYRCLSIQMHSCHAENQYNISSKLRANDVGPLLI